MRPQLHQRLDRLEIPQAAPDLERHARVGQRAQFGFNAAMARLGPVQIDDVYEVRALVAPAHCLLDGVLGEHGFLAVIALDKIDATPAANVHRGQDAHHDWAPSS